jgi:hypothetical protein
MTNQEVALLLDGAIVKIRASEDEPDSRPERTGTFIEIIEGTNGSLARVILDSRWHEQRTADDSRPADNGWREIAVELLDIVHGRRECVTCTKHFDVDALHVSKHATECSRCRRLSEATIERNNFRNHIFPLKVSELRALYLRDEDEILDGQSYDIGMMREELYRRLKEKLQATLGTPFLAKMLREDKY